MASKRRPPKKRAEGAPHRGAPAGAAPAPTPPAEVVPAPALSAPVSGLPLFYRRPQVLHPAAHGGLVLDTGAGHGFAAAAHAVPLQAAEVVAASRHAPVVFSRGADPMPLMVLGLNAGQGNLFVDAQGRWRADAYIPAYVRRYPFVFLEDATQAAFTLCIDEAAPGLRPAAAGPKAGESAVAQPLFDDRGQPTALTSSALDLCRDYQAQQATTRRWMQALVAAGVLVERRADVVLADGRTLAVEGFQVIDEERLAALPAAELIRLRDAGWLPAVYAHLASAGLWPKLADWASHRPAG